MGSNKLVAKVATKEAKPGREVFVAAGAEREYLAPWSVRVLPGAGRKIGDRLEQLNVQRVQEVAAMPVPILRGLFGNHGRVLHEQSLGIDYRPVEAHKPPLSVSRRTSFDPPSGDRNFLRSMLDYLVERAGSWLRAIIKAPRPARLSIPRRIVTRICKRGFATASNGCISGACHCGCWGWCWRRS